MRLSYSLVVKIRSILLCITMCIGIGFIATAQAKTLTRAEFLQQQLRATVAVHQVSACDTTILPFADVPTSHPLRNYICYAYTNGIIHGYPNGLFKPDQKITVNEEAKIIVLANQFDYTPTSIWYEGFVSAIVNAKSTLPSRGLISNSHSSVSTISTTGQHTVQNTSRNSIGSFFTVTVPTSSSNSEELSIRKNHSIHTTFAQSSTSSPSDSSLSFGSSASKISTTSKQSSVSLQPSDVQASSVSSVGISSTTSYSSKQLVQSKLLTNSSSSTTVIPANDSSINIQSLTDTLSFMPPELKVKVQALLASTATVDGAITLYNYDDLYLYIWRDGSVVQRMVLYIDGNVLPAKNGLWQQLEGSTLKQVIISAVPANFSEQDIPAATLPGHLQAAVQKYYGGSISFNAGVHAIAQLEINGVLQKVLSAISYPTDHLQVLVGHSVPGMNLNTATNATVEASKNKGNPADALKPTNFIEITKTGIWPEPLDMQYTTLTDATVYLDDGLVFGFWGKGTFDSEKFAMFYQGPLKFTKDPQDYLEAQAGFAAENMNLTQYIKLISAYNSRFPGSSYAFMGPAEAARDEVLNATFTALNALPLDIVTIQNDLVTTLNVQPGSKFPGTDIFNVFILAPLAEGKDGTKGPVVHIKGDGYVLNKQFGDLQFTVNTSGATGTANGSLSLPLGSAAGQSLGNAGGAMLLSIEANPSVQIMNLTGTVDAGPLVGRTVIIAMQPTSFTFNSPASCVFPFNVNANFSVKNPATLTLNNINFNAQAIMPEPTVLLSCPEDIFMLIENGVVFAFNGTQKLAEFAVDLLPENNVTRIGSEGVKFAAGTITAGAQELQNIASAIPGVSQARMAAKQAAAESARLAKQAAEKAAKEAAAAAKKAANEAAKAAERAAQQAVKSAQQALNESARFTTNLVSGAAANVINGLGSVTNSIGGAVGSIFGGGSSGPPGFGWLMYCCGHKAIDISLGHNNDMWYIEEDGQAWFAYEAPPHQYAPNKAMDGSFDADFTGFSRIDADEHDRAVAVDTRGKLYYIDTNGMWRRSDNPLDFAIDIGIGGGYLWAISTQPEAGGYKVYRTKYQSGRGNWTWEYMHGHGTRVDVGSDGRAWIINNVYNVYEYNNGWQFRNGTGLDISVSNTNRAWIIGSNYNTGAGGGQVFTYERARDRYILGSWHHTNAFWQPTAGYAKNIAAGNYTSIMVSNHVNNIYGGTGRQ